jgi:hypothetical protein
MTHTTSTQGATEKQLTLIKKLMIERGVEAKSGYDWSRLSRKTASDTIERLLKMPKVTSATTGKPVLADGLYVFGGEVYKVKRANGSGQPYASVLVPGVDGAGGSFTYVKGMTYKIKPEHKMTIEQAKAHGALYGQCAACGRLLSNDESIELGIGPVCRDKYFG